MEGNLFCHDTGSIQGRSIFFGLFLYLKPLKVIIYIYVASRSAFAHKDATCITETFSRALFLENEAQTDQKNYGTMLFMSKQVGLPKISSILQKVKIGPKTDIPHFCTKAFNCNRQKSKIESLPTFYTFQVQQNLQKVSTTLIAYHFINLKIMKNI